MLFTSFTDKTSLRTNAITDSATKTQRNVRVCVSACVKLKPDMAYGEVGTLKIDKLSRFCSDQNMAVDLRIILNWGSEPLNK